MSSHSGWEQAPFGRLSVWCFVFNVIVSFGWDLPGSKTSFTEECAISFNMGSLFPWRKQQTKQILHLHGHCSGPGCISVSNVPSTTTPPSGTLPSSFKTCTKGRFWILKNRLASAHLVGNWWCCLWCCVGQIWLGYDFPSAQMLALFWYFPGLQTVQSGILCHSHASVMPPFYFSVIWWSTFPFK